MLNKYVLSKRAEAFVAVILVITAIKIVMAFIAAVVVLPAFLALTVRKPPGSTEPEAAPASSEG